MTVNEFIERVELDVTVGGRTRIRLLSVAYLNNAMRMLCTRVKKPVVTGKLEFQGDKVLGLEQGQAIKVYKVWYVKEGRRIEIPYLSDMNGVFDSPAPSVGADDRFMYSLGTEDTYDGIFLHASKGGVWDIGKDTVGFEALNFKAEAVIAPQVISDRDRIPLPDPWIVGALTFAVKAQIAYDLGQVERGVGFNELFERSVASENTDMKSSRQNIPDTHMLRSR
jgi:hypothetical protein